MLGSNFDFDFPADLGDDAPSTQYNKWHWELPAETTFQIDETVLH